jgi:hypothetical protein
LLQKINADILHVIALLHRNALTCRRIAETITKIPTQYQLAGISKASVSDYI